MSRKTWLLLLTVVACVVVGLGLAHGATAAVQAYSLDWSVVGAGGNASTQLASTIGQTAIGWSNGSHQLGSGFWYGAGSAAPYRVFLPLLLRKQ